MSGSPQSLAYGPAGTWTRDDATLSIRYRPVAHADPVLTAWLELLAAAPQLTESPIIMAVFNELSKPTSPGLCVSCHSIERTAVGQLMINWRALDRTKEPRGFTNFSHGPHLVLPQLADCTHCHAIVESKTPAASYTDWNPESFVSEFAPVTKRQCVECHTARRAGDGCQKCHNYHVEGIESWRLKSTTVLRQPAAVLTMSIR
jgi:ferredoxin-like protein FixX